MRKHTGLLLKSKSRVQKIPLLFPVRSFDTLRPNLLSKGKMKKDKNQPKSIDVEESH